MSRSQSSQAMNASFEDEDSSDDMYDFMDGAATKQLKKQKAKVPTQVKQEPIGLNESITSIKSKSSMRTRKQRKTKL